MITSVTNENCFEFRGSQTDTKPIGNNCTNANVDFPISNGSVFLDMDTSTVYILKLTEHTSESETTYTGEWLVL